MSCYSKYKRVSIALFLSAITFCLFSQTGADPVCMEINREKIHLSDLLNYSVKNNLPEHTDSTTIAGFTTYFLKLTEAKSLQLDKTARFRKEMDEYRTRIISPYLNRNLPDEELIRREYDRMKQTNDLSIIRIPFFTEAALSRNIRGVFPGDTLAAFEKAMKIYRLCTGSDYFGKPDSIIQQDGTKPQHIDNAAPMTYPMSIENVVYAMNPGEISKPTRYENGYFIVKVRNKKENASPLPLPEKARSRIINQLKQSGAGLLLTEPALSKLKTQNKYTPDPKSYKRLRKSATTVYPADAKFFALFENDTNPLFSAQDTTISTGEFISFLKKQRLPLQAVSTELLNNYLKMFEFEVLSHLENRLVETRYPEAASLLNEYRKDLLVLYITEKEVWNKTSENRKELETYFNGNREKYTWNTPRYKGYVVHCRTVGERKQIQREIAGINIDSAAVFLTQKYIDSKTKPEIKLSKKELFIKGRNEYVDELAFKTGKKGVPYLEYPRYFVFGYVLSQPEEYTDVISFLVNDYQKYREEEWIQELSLKYPVTIYPEILSTITNRH